MKKFIKRLPVLGPVLHRVHNQIVGSAKRFSGSEQYWIDRYRMGGNSGPGSYDRFAEFKAQILNAFVEKHSIGSVIEFGCGDGNQLKIARYPSYLGFDISPDSIELCNAIFSDDGSKEFRLMQEYDQDRATLALSLDVIFHLVEDDVFDDYMSNLFDSADSYVIIYSSDTESQRSVQSDHVRHRKFTKWVSENRPDWRLREHVPNKYPYCGDATKGTSADFFIYERSTV